MKGFKWVAEGASVYMIHKDTRELFCTLSAGLLTPKLAAQETAAALNARYNSEDTE